MDRTQRLDAAREFASGLKETTKRSVDIETAQREYDKTEKRCDALHEEVDSIRAEAQKVYERELDRLGFKAAHRELRDTQWELKDRKADLDNAKRAAFASARDMIGNGLGKLIAAADPELGRAVAEA